MNHHKYSLTGSYLNSNERHASKKAPQYLKNDPQSPRDFADAVGDHDSAMKDNKELNENQRGQNSSPFTSSVLATLHQPQAASSFVSPYLKAQRHPSFRNDLNE
jgi:hypothetical protein